ncbi:MAG: hypothetical protein RLZZ505_1355 [Verrucomicrobiota bacterium]|jgi:hypothetical protein
MDGGKNLSFLLYLAALAFFGSPARADKPLKDYSFIRGVNHVMTGDTEILKRDLGYAKRLNLNSTRIWLSFEDYEKNPQAYVDRLRDYIRVSHQLGFSTMPILLNGNYLNPETIKPEFRARGDAYVKGIVQAVKDEPGLLMWDIMNEPFTNDYHDKAPEQERPQRKAEITDFVRYQLSHVKSLDPVNALTVGHAYASDLETTADLVDVLSFHDYTPLRTSVEEAYRIAAEASKKTGKPMLNSETGCIARGNPYDMVLEIAEKHQTGWYLFNLIIEGYWGEIHGLVYPDGTIRDPAAIAAVMGFHRNRNLNSIIRPAPNREGQAERALKSIEDALKDNQDAFHHSKTPTDIMLDAAEYAAHLLESAEMIPMHVPPTARIKFWREQPPHERDRDAIRTFAFDLGHMLKKYCLIY